MKFIELKDDTETHCLNLDYVIEAILRQNENNPEEMEDWEIAITYANLQEGCDCEIFLQYEKKADAVKEYNKFKDAVGA